MSIFPSPQPSGDYAHLPKTDMQIIPDTRAANAISTRDILACRRDPAVKSVERSSAAVYSCEPVMVSKIQQRGRGARVAYQDTSTDTVQDANR